MSALLTGFCLRSVRHMLAGKVDEERLELQEGGEEPDASPPSPATSHPLPLPHRPSLHRIRLLNADRHVSCVPDARTAPLAHRHRLLRAVHAPTQLRGVQLHADHPPTGVLFG